MMKNLYRSLILLALSILFQMNAFTQTTIHLWPNAVPGETKEKAKAVISDNTKGDIARISEVTDPLIELFLPEVPNESKAGILVCPGGGYHILAIEHEGYEVAEWLNKLGYAAFVLQYRVPKKQEGALMDAQRAMRIIRGRADEWNIDPGKIGILGFSAGGSLSARTSTLYDQKTYEPVDEMDSLSCRPDYAILIYPAYLDQGENNTLTPELNITENTPPMFIFVAADDKYANSSLVMTSALREKNIPVELHVLPYGGHGYGLRPGKRAAETWPVLAGEWLKTLN